MRVLFKLPARAQGWVERFTGRSAARAEAAPAQSTTTWAAKGAGAASPLSALEQPHQQVKALAEALEAELLKGPKGSSRKVASLGRKLEAQSATVSDLIARVPRTQDAVEPLKRLALEAGQLGTRIETAATEPTVWYPGTEPARSLRGRSFENRKALAEELAGLAHIRGGPVTWSFNWPLVALKGDSPAQILARADQDLARGNAQARPLWDLQAASNRVVSQVPAPAARQIDAILRDLRIAKAPNLLWAAVDRIKTQAEAQTFLRWAKSNHAELGYDLPTMADNLGWLLDKGSSAPGWSKALIAAELLTP